MQPVALLMNRVLLIAAWAGVAAAYVTPTSFRGAH